MSKITALEHLRASAQASRLFVMGLIGDIAGTVAEALEELDKVKADKSNAVPITIPTTGWEDNSAGARYPKYYDIAVSGITAKDRAHIVIAPGNLDTAKACGMCQTNETMAGKIRILAESVPQETIAAEYHIESGKGE